MQDEPAAGRRRRTSRSVRSSSKDGFVKPTSIGGPGHFLSLKHQADRGANDRFQVLQTQPSGRSRTCDASRHQVPTECLLVKGSNRHCGPISDIRRNEFVAVKPSLRGAEKADVSQRTLELGCTSAPVGSVHRPHPRQRPAGRTVNFIANGHRLFPKSTIVSSALSPAVSPASSRTLFPSGDAGCDRQAGRRR